MQIARLVGGAGTGKTTELLRIMEGALKTIRDPTLLGFASFTRAARHEAASRASAAWNIEPEILTKKGWFRTVHSTVLRCLGDAADALIGDTKKDIEWLSAALGVNVGTEIDDAYGSTRYIGDEHARAAMACWSLARVTLQSLEGVVKKARAINDDIPDYEKIVMFAERYETAKRLDSKMDFTDALMRFAGVSISPRHGVMHTQPIGFLPEVHAWLFDEQQDASPLLDLVCRRLISAPTVKWCYVVGDPFQAIYGFAGSSASCFMSWNAEKSRIMPKSYRCPKPILELGERCLRRMINGGYFDRKIAPADHDGAVNEALLEDVIEKARPDEDWLFVARTNFQASRVASALASMKRPMRWVSQHDGDTNRAAGLAGLYALERGEPISGLQWAHAIDLIPWRLEGGGELTKRGAKKRWATDPQLAESWDRIWPDELLEVGGTELLVDTIKQRKVFSYVDRGMNWREMAKKWGVECASRSKIRVGTIHSVKGAEADNVAVFTTTSRTVERGCNDEHQANEECRIAYVAVTRAKKNLYIVDENKNGTPKMEIL